MLYRIVTINYKIGDTMMFHKKINNFVPFLKFLHLQKSNLIDGFHKQNELQNIMENVKIQTFFQPIVSFSDGCTLGVECLNRPTFSEEFPSTESFYDFIGKSKDIFSVEQLLRRLSIRRFTEQTDEQQQLKDRLIFLNIHPQVLMDPNFRSGFTVELLQEFQISPYQIVLELTEKEAFENVDHFEQLVDHYRNQGFRIAVDDAGSGYNSLKTLLRAKPEFIKLDKCLIRHIDKHPEKQHLVELLLDFANLSDTTIIAEGIEDQEEFSLLKKIGVHYGQGYALGKPSKNLCPGQLPTTSEVYKKRLG